MNDNPYCSPIDVDRAWYDHRLFWRIVRACLVIGLCFLLLDLLSAAIYLGSVSPTRWFSALNGCMENDMTRFVARFFDERT